MKFITSSFEYRKEKRMAKVRQVVSFSVADPEIHGPQIERLHAIVIEV